MSSLLWRDVCNIPGHQWWDSFWMPSILALCWMLWIHGKEADLGLAVMGAYTQMHILYPAWGARQGFVKKRASVVPQKTKGVRAQHRKNRKCKNIEVWKTAFWGKFEKLACLLFCNGPSCPFSSDSWILWDMGSTMLLRCRLKTSTEILRLDPGHWNIPENFD